MARSSTTYQPKWKAGDTTVIRVPIKLAADIMAYARQLDMAYSGESVHDPVAVYHTAEDCMINRPVNVASVPQRSPFRYPGGKTWLVPYIRSWLSRSIRNVNVLIEPFAGGAIVGLTAGFEELAKHVVLVEKDTDVASVWQTIFGGQADWLADRIQQFELTRENAVIVLNKYWSTQRERAFSVILRNRVQRGGIMAQGAGLIKSGENGRGINSRWYPDTLARRIREIALMRERFSFIEGDGFDAIRRYADDDQAFFFVDPPYTVAARRLYPHWQIDHHALFELLQGVHGDVLLTYDNTVEIKRLAAKFGFETQAIAMKNTHHAEMTELLIGRDLSWLKHAINDRESHVQNSQGTLVFLQ